MNLPRRRPQDLMPAGKSVCALRPSHCGAAMVNIRRRESVRVSG
jgi:hypothetical protein